MEQTLRQKAIAWWKQLPAKANDNFISKRFFFERYENQRFTPALNYTELTGREIQSIYESEHPTNSVLDTVDNTSNDGSNPVKNYVGVSFKHKDKNDIYTVFDVEDDTVFYFNKYSEKSFRKLSDFERCLAKGEWVIVTESEVLPVHKSIDENGDLLTKESTNISPIETFEQKWKRYHKNMTKNRLEDIKHDENCDTSNVDYAIQLVSEMLYDYRNQPKFYSQEQVDAMLDIQACITTQQVLVNTPKSYSEDEVIELLNMLDSVTTAYISSIPALNRKPYQQELMERSKSLIHKFKTNKLNN